MRLWLWRVFWSWTTSWDFSLFDSWITQSKQLPSTTSSAWHGHSWLTRGIKLADHRVKSMKPWAQIFFFIFVSGTLLPSHRSVTYLLYGLVFYRVYDIIQWLHADGIYYLRVPVSGIGALVSFGARIKADNECSVITGGASHHHWPILLLRRSLEILTVTKGRALPRCINAEDRGQLLVCSTHNVKCCR